MQEIRKNLAEKLEDYVQIIIEEYGEYIPETIKEKHLLRQDYIDCIKIEETKKISLFYRENAIYFPKLAFSIIDKLKEHPEYGTVPNHKCYDQHTIIKNQNTFTDYINHVIISGFTPKEYFEENLLHETMHFCGSGGADPLREGFTELKTREIAQKEIY